MPTYLSMALEKIMYRVGLVALLLTGCAGVQTTELDAQTQIEALRIQEVELAQPTIEIRCDTGCQGLLFVYNDPKKTRTRTPTTSADVAIERTRAWTGVIKSITPVVAGVWLGGKVVDALEGAGSVYNMTTQEGDNRVGDDMQKISGDNIGGDNIGSVDSNDDNSVIDNTIDSHDDNSIKQEPVE